MVKTSKIIEPSTLAAPLCRTLQAIEKLLNHTKKNGEKSNYQTDNSRSQAIREIFLVPARLLSKKCHELKVISGYVYFHTETVLPLSLPFPPPGVDQLSSAMVIPRPAAGRGCHLANRREEPKPTNRT